MKITLALLCLISLMAIANPSAAQTRQAPVSVTVSQNQKDTVIKATATLTHYSDSSTAAAMRDTAYLHNLSGKYRISFSTDTVTINVSDSNTLLINIPGRGKHELIPIMPIFFKVSGLTDVKILVFIDRFGQSRGINIIDEQQPTGSPKRQIDANKLGTFRN